MAIRQTGVDLVVKNFQSFVTNLRSGENAAEKFDKKIDQLTHRLKGLFDSMEVAGKATDQQNLRVTNALDRMRGAYESLTIALAQLVETQNSEKVTAKQILAAQDKVNKAYLNARTSTRNYEIAVADYQKTEIKTKGIADNTERALGQLEKRYEEVGNQASQLVQTMAGFVPGGSKVVSVLESVGLAGKFAGPALIAVAAAMTTLKVASMAVNAAINIVQFTIKAAVNAVKGLGNAIVGAFKGVLGILDAVTRPLRTFIQHVVEVASGIALWRFLRNLGAGFSNVAEEVFNAVASFQLLEIRLESITARDVSRGLGIPMKEAFDKVAGSASGLFDWMRKLAVQTNYTVEDLAEFFTMSTAMGITIDKSKELTEATVDFASALGLSGDIMQRIIYNFGQMIQRGKLSGEEFRDLARNFVPIDQIMRNLAEKANMNTVAFRQFALEGGVPVMDFINEFVRIAQTDYPGAAAKMARTWEGVTNNIRDFVQTFIGIDTLKPLLDRFAGRMADLLDRVVSDDKLQRTSKFFGQTLVRAFEYITPAVDALVNAIQYLFSVIFGGAPRVGETTDRLGLLADRAEDAGSRIYGWGRTIAKVFFTAVELVKRYLESLAEKIKDAAGDRSPLQLLVERAKSWGINFVRAFSQGITGAVRILTTAISVVAGIVRKWFESHSPPLLAPDIDKWGMATMNAWLSGFTLADFSIFDDISRLVESYFRSLGDDIAKEGLIPMILSARDALGRALSGVGPQNIFGGMIATGNVSALFQDYLDTLVAIEHAQKAVDIATDSVNRARNAVDEARKAYQNFDESLYGVADAERAVAQAGEEIDAIQKQINDKTEEYNSILANLRNQLTQVTEEYDETVRLREIEQAFATQRLTAEERERLEMEKRGIEIRQQIRAVEGQRDVEVEALKSQLAEAKAKEESAKARLEAIKGEIKAAKELLQINIDNAEAELESARARQESAQSNVDALKGHAEAVKRQIELIIEQNNFLREQKKILGELAEAQDQVLEQEFKMPELDTHIEDFSKEIDAIIAEAKRAADDMATAFGEISNAWKEGGAAGAFEGLKGALDDLSNVVNLAVGGDGNGGWFDSLQRGWQKIRDALGIPTDQNFLEWLADKVSEFAPIVVGAGAFILTGAEFIYTGSKKIYDAVKDYFDINPVNRMPTMGASLLKAAQDIFKAGAILVEIGNRIEQSFPGASKAFSDSVGTIMKAGATLTLAPFIPFFGPLFAILKTFETLVQALPALTDIIVDKLGRVRDAIGSLLDIWDDLRAGLGVDPQSVYDLVNTIFGLPIGNVLDPNFLRSIGIPGFASGGKYPTGRPFLVGERGPEIMMIDTPGTVYPDVDQFKKMMSSVISAPRLSAPLSPGAGDVDRSINIEINPTYRQVQSEASIYYDLTAALAMVGR